MRPERETQNRIVKLLSSKLGYNPLFGGNLQERISNSNIECLVLETFLQKKGYSDSIISKAIAELRKCAAVNSADELYPINQTVYSLL